MTIIEDVKTAVDYAISQSQKEDAICVAGSLYVAGEAKEKFDNDLEQKANLKEYDIFGRIIQPGTKIYGLLPIQESEYPELNFSIEEVQVVESK